MKTKVYIFNHQQLMDQLKEAYRNGFATAEMVEAGLETYDALGYALWTIASLKPVEKECTNIHREGAGCSLNDNCKFPNCLT